MDEWGGVNGREADGEPESGVGDWRSSILTKWKPIYVLTFRIEGGGIRSWPHHQFALDVVYYQAASDGLQATNYTY